jgi:hypothetical protein
MSNLGHVEHNAGYVQIIKHFATAVDVMFAD